MQTAEAQQRVADERAALEAALERIPFDFDTAGSVRVQAYKAAVHHAHKVLNRNSGDPSVYTNARLEITSIATAPVEHLAARMWGDE